MTVTQAAIVAVAVVGCAFLVWSVLYHERPAKGRHRIDSFDVPPPVPVKHPMDAAHPPVDFDDSPTRLISDTELQTFFSMLHADPEVDADTKHGWSCNRQLEAHPNAWLAQPGRLCGDGSSCDKPGDWGVRGYVHAYCAKHAVERLGEEVER